MILDETKQGMQRTLVAFCNSENGELSRNDIVGELKENAKQIAQAVRYRVNLLIKRR